MLSLYLASLGFGGVLIATSFLFGGDADKDFDKDFDVDKDFDFEADITADVEVDADVDADADVDVDAEADATIGGGGHSEDLAGATGVLSWLPFTSMRFWSFGNLTFGLAGTMLELMLGNSPTVLALAIIIGVMMGSLMASFFRFLKKDSASGDVKLDRFVHQEARVLIPIRPGEEGMIVFQTLGGRVELRAKSGDKDILEAGANVLCAHIKDGVALVTALDDPLKKQKQRAKRAARR